MMNNGNYIVHAKQTSSVKGLHYKWSTFFCNQDIVYTMQCQMKYIFKLDTTENLHPGIHHSNMGLLTSYDIISIFSNPYPLAAQSKLSCTPPFKRKSYADAIWCGKNCKH